MKNIFKFMGIALMACSLTLVACNKDNNNGDQPAAGSFSVTIGGTNYTDTLQFVDAQCGEMQGVMSWLFQAARRSEGTSVYFPYIVDWLYGDQAEVMSNVDNADIELYLNTYLTASGNNYGDYQLDTEADNTVNVSAIDMNNYKLSVTQNFTMYSLVDYNDAMTQGASDPEAYAAAGRLNLVIGFNNYPFVLYTGK